MQVIFTPIHSRLLPSFPVKPIQSSYRPTVPFTVRPFPLTSITEYSPFGFPRKTLGKILFHFRHNPFHRCGKIAYFANENKKQK